MQNSSGSKARRKTVGYRSGLSWSEDIETQWQTVFGSNWTKATEGHPGKTVVGPGMMCIRTVEISLGSDSF